jgi:asparagine synthase (glutamine-hydrolysing)
VVFIARDRLGVKPLYYWTSGKILVFASEIKAILEYGEVPREPNLEAIDAYLSFRYVPGPQTMFAGIRKLPAAHTLEWRAGDVRVQRYWTPFIEQPAIRKDQEYQERFDELLQESVRLRLISDVPLGAFLSGGVDSSALVATMARTSSTPVKTFSVGFDWPGDELPLARDLAGQLACEHHEVICRPSDMSLLPQIVWALDEPVGDPIVLPMYLVARLARQHVTVALSGEGADETLAGYFMHRALTSAHRFTRVVPRPVREWVVHPLLSSTPPALLDRAFDYPGRLGERGKQKLLDFLAMLSDATDEERYHFLISLFDTRDKSLLYGPRLPVRATSIDQTMNRQATVATGLEAILRLQFGHWLQDDILTKLDKMTMVNSLEGRVPYLDHKLVEFLVSVPAHLKLRKGENKVLLRDYVARSVPTGTAVARRPKKAFYVPLEQYISADPLSEMLDICLSEESVRKRGYFHWRRVRALREAVAEPGFVYGKQVFALLMLELWHRIFIDREQGWITAPSHPTFTPVEAT